MTLTEYQNGAVETIAYENDDIALDCTIAGLIGELGELMELWKKYRRGDYKKEDVSEIDAFEEFQKNTALEAGDLLWYIAVYLYLWNIDMDKVGILNYEKLHERLDKDLLHASKTIREDAYDTEE